MGCFRKGDAGMKGLHACLVRCMRCNSPVMLRMCVGVGVGVGVDVDVVYCGSNGRDALRVDLYLDSWMSSLVGEAWMQVSIFLGGWLLATVCLDVRDLN